MLRLAILTLFIGFAAAAAPDDQITLGKWIGYLQPEGSRDALSVTLDNYLLKPEGVKEYPHLQFSFRIGLGGYFGAEYESEIFDNPKYDYDSRRLTFDDPHNEMVVTATVNAGRLEGDVYLRSSAMHAKLVLVFQTGDVAPETPPLAPTLAGQWEGKCGDEQTVLQLETGKGLTVETPGPTTGLHHYNITGTLGVVNGICPSVARAGRPAYCVDHSFASGTYDFYQRKLFLSGTLETERCDRDRDELICRMRLLPKDSDKKDLVRRECRFKKTAPATTPYHTFARAHHVTPTLAQTRPLPAPTPPKSEALVGALTGSFYGYVHHEYRDRYQPMRLDVIASTSADNPHLQNDVFVSVTSVLFFGREKSQDFWAQQFDRRALYLVPGYTLKSELSDTFLQITEWKQGYVAGVWYSRAFGRVGTFEVAKHGKFPALDASARVIEPVSGEYRGSPERSRDLSDYWNLSVLVPKQPRSMEQSFLLFQGNYRQHVAGVDWPTRVFSRGAYDLYTGSLAWLTDDSTGGEPKLVTGRAEDPGILNLYWPGDRAWAVGIFDRALETYRRRNEDED